MVHCLQEKPAKGGGFLKSLSSKKKTKLGSDSAGQEATMDAMAAMVAAPEPDSSMPVRLPEISVAAEPCLEVTTTPCGPAFCPPGLL